MCVQQVIENHKTLLKYYCHMYGLHHASIAAFLLTPVPLDTRLPREDSCHTRHKYPQTGHVTYTKQRGFYTLLQPASYAYVFVSRGDINMITLRNHDVVTGTAICRWCNPCVRHFSIEIGPVRPRGQIYETCFTRQGSIKTVMSWPSRVSVGLWSLILYRRCKRTSICI